MRFKVIHRFFTGIYCQFLDWFGKRTESDGKNLLKHDNRVLGKFIVLFLKWQVFFSPISFTIIAKQYIL